MCTPYPGPLFISGLEKYARLLVEYSVGVRKGEEVVIRGSVESLPLLREIYREVLIHGGYPTLLLEDPLINEILYKYASEEQLAHISPQLRIFYEEFDARISILSSPHTRTLVSVDPSRQAIRRRAIAPLSQRFLKEAAEGKRKWTIAPYPTLAMSQEADMSPKEFEEFVYRAVKLHYNDPIKAWENQAAKQKRVIEKLLSKASEVTIKGPNVDLSLSVDGRTWISDDGHENMPGGEVFTGPVEDSVNGCIRFDYPAVYAGRIVEGVKLCFRNGAVSYFDAVRGRDFLERMVNLDEGSRRLGEFAFGLNYDITRPTKEVLFDEKIGGTIHLALGMGYPETGSRNTSAIHWDMVKDMRSKDARVYIDGDLVYEAGKFIGWDEKV